MEMMMIDDDAGCCVDQIGWEKCITHKEDSCEGIYIPWAQANCQAFCGFCQRRYLSLVLFSSSPLFFV